MTAPLGHLPSRVLTLTLALLLGLAPTLGLLGPASAGAQPSLPDLVPTAVSANVSSASWDQTVRVSWTVENRSEQAVPEDEGGWYDRIYLSADTVLDEYDAVFYDTYSRESLQAGERYTRSAIAEVPDVPSGTYYLLAVVDPIDWLTESDETNNVVVGARIAISGVDLDLVPTALTANRTAVTWYEPVTVSWTVERRGAEILPGEAASIDELYLSTDTTLDPDDRNIDDGHNRFDHPLTGQDGRFAVTVDTAMPEVAPGTYYLLVEVDSHHDLPERDETNNVVAGPTIAVSGLAIDLEPTAMTASVATALPGEEITVSWTVANRGPDAIPPSVFKATRQGMAHWTDTVYLSSDTTLDDTDVSFVNGGGMGPLAAGESYSATEEGWVPLVPGGTYHLLLAVQPDVMPETDETNNVLVGPTLTITAPSVDLVPTSLIVDTSAARWDEPITVSWTAANQGPDAVPAHVSWFDAIYLSNDARLDDTDLVLDYTTENGPVNAGGTYSDTLTVEPYQIPSGTYYVLVGLGSGYYGYPDLGLDLETDRTNNWLAGPRITITGLNFDLVAAELTVDRDRAVPGEAITVSWSVANQGTDPFPAGEYIDVELVLTADPARHDGELELAGDATYQIREGPLAPGDRYSGELVATVPNITPGTYYLLLSAYYPATPGHTPPSDADWSNNELAIPFTVEPSMVHPAAGASPALATPVPPATPADIAVAGRQPIGGVS